jgi:hypothetical protein
MKHYKSHFRNMSSLLDKAVNGECNDNIRPVDRSSRLEREHFTGTKTFEDAVSLATGGWPEGRTIITNFTKQYSGIWSKFFPQQDFGTELSGGVSGSIPQIGEYLIGNPESMLDFTPNEVESNLAGCKLQRIILNGAVSCGIGIETILQYGGLIGALVNSMELSGFNIELIICWGGSSSPFMSKNKMNSNAEVYSRYSLTIKEFNQQLDTDKLAFCLAHSSMFRRFIFSLMEQEDDYYCQKLGVPGWYSYPVNILEEEITLFGSEGRGVLKHGNMYFRMLDSNYNLDQLVEQCTAVVKNQFTEVNFNKE